MSAATTPKQDLIEKAGGLIVRDSDSGEKEIYVVHRGRHNDWSVPKGHIDSGETPVQAAIREVGEETGFHCSIQQQLPPYFYQTPEGQQVVVHFFLMQVMDQGLETDKEVDKAEWVPVSHIHEKITYPSLQEYIRSAVEE